VGQVVQHDSVGVRALSVAGMVVGDVTFNANAATVSDSDTASSLAALTR
jgi:hypothetical protein